MAITTISKVKTILHLQDNSLDAVISELIPLVEADYLLIRNKPFEKDENGKDIYPLGSERVAIKMIQYLLQKNAPNISSERLADYSVSYDTGTGKDGYPESITQLIKRYVSFV